MLVLKLKEIEDLRKKIGNKNLLIQCSLCPGWNFSKNEIEEFSQKLNSEIKRVPTICNRPKIEIDDKYDSILVLACGAGIQIVSESLQCEVIPAADTTGIGVKFKDKIEVYCRACGNCILDETSGICPIARCSKSLLNGPCGGVHDGKCEVNDVECAWILILERMKKFNALNRFVDIRMPELEK